MKAVYPLRNGDQIIWTPQTLTAIQGTIFLSAIAAGLTWLIYLAAAQIVWSLLFLLFLGIVAYMLQYYVRSIFGLKATGYILSNSSIQFGAETVGWSEIERFIVTEKTSESATWYCVEAQPREALPSASEKALVSIDGDLFIWSGHAKQEEANMVCSWLNGILDTPGEEVWQRRVNLPPRILRIKWVPASSDS
ncbi:MAG: hypothetical protein IPK59_08140 [Rhodospirillaceae bacterium]|nr:hypothetical protein [Rhodospirillaceae bacterium]